MTELRRRALHPVMLVIFAVTGGLLVGMIAANIWPVLLTLAKLDAVTASVVEVVFLLTYALWFTGVLPGPWRRGRRNLGRGGPLRSGQWGWGVLTAFAFAGTIHAAMVVLFRLIPYPAAAFHAGYDFSFIPTAPLRLLACVISALSAGVCEEIGFRGYMQRPLELRFGPVIAVAMSATVFTLLHLNKSWALMAMTPIVFGAGLLLGALARASGTLVFPIVGHWVMDIGLFAYWWVQVLGTFQQRPIAETGIGVDFLVEVAVFAGLLSVTLTGIARLRGLRWVDERSS